METQQREPTHPYRFFIAYSHRDADVAQGIAEHLEKLGFCPWYDRDLELGNPFAEGIRWRIETCHVFVPILTQSMSKRPWVHQEIGYAVGCGVPVLPVAVDIDPSEMIHGLQALRIKTSGIDRLGSLGEELKQHVPTLERTIFDAGRRAKGRFECAVWPEDRANMIAEYAERALQLEKTGNYSRPTKARKVRQIGGFSSFSIPKEHYTLPVWDARDAKPRSEYYRMLQWRERVALEKLVSKFGCDLIIDPDIEYPDDVQSQRAKLARLETLLKFLRDDKISEVRVVVNQAAQRENALIVGDWFYCQSMAPRPTVGYFQTIFTWHAPRVLYEMSRFDVMFEHCEKIQGGSSRKDAAKKVQSLIDEIRKRWGDDTD